jgi:hypothetical protein
MRLLAMAVLLVACGEDPRGMPDGGVAADAGEVDADPGAPRALTPGTYELEWTCLDGCGPLPFPPKTYNRLEVSEGFQLRWYTEAALNEKLAPAGLSDSLCVVSAALQYSEGATDAIGFCAEVDGPEADVVFTADYGPQPTRTWRAKALPRR